MNKGLKHRDRGRSIEARDTKSILQRKWLNKYCTEIMNFMIAIFLKTLCAVSFITQGELASKIEMT